MAFFTTPSDGDVAALIRQQYPDAEFDAIMELLGPINNSGEMVGWDAARIQFAALAMSCGNRNLISQYIDLGNTEARDLQMVAEWQLGPSWESDWICKLK